MNRQETIDKLKTIVKPYVTNDAAFENLTESTDFINDLRINSANLVDIVLDIEEAFGIEIDNQSMEKNAYYQRSFGNYRNQTGCKMIGNDIIDLELARKQSNWKREGFLKKIFTDSEQQLILKSENTELIVWSFWSRKEASYKIFNRQTNLRIYNPLQFECSKAIYSEGFYYGKVTNGDAVYYSKTEITTAYIHTIAATNPDDFIKIRNLSERGNIFKKNGIPYLEKENGKSPVSISHHGRYNRIISI